jgi:hypothetical protein
MLLASVYALKGERAKELQQLEEGKAVAQRGELPAFFVAVAYARLGDKNEAIEWLQRSYQNKEIMIADINVFPPFDPLRSDPRFETLVQKVFAPKTGSSP